MAKNWKRGKFVNLMDYDLRPDKRSFSLHNKKKGILINVASPELNERINGETRWHIDTMKESGEILEAEEFKTRGGMMVYVNKTGKKYS